MFFPGSFEESGHEISCELSDDVVSEITGVLRWCWKQQQETSQRIFYEESFSKEPYTMTYTYRMNRLHEELATSGFGAMVFNAGPTLGYLTGLDFHLMERPVVLAVSRGEVPVLILPELEMKKLEGRDQDFQVFAYGENPEQWPAVFRKALQDLELAGQKIGIEPGQMRILEYQYLQAAIADFEYVDGSSYIARLRARKDAVEVATMRKAVQIAEQALEATLPMVKAGVTEQAIAAELVVQLLRHGSQSSLPFAPIVAAGENSANPHARPTERVLIDGDLLVIDWGARYKGYCSDLTRTFAIGRPDQESLHIHQLVLEANRAGRAAGAAGVCCADVDRAAREVIVTGGYGAQFVHRTGHGIGLDCHEHPYIHGDNPQLLEIGTTYTVEPGIYLTGHNGVRIEDDVIVTKNGAESLSTMSRELQFL